MNTLCIDDKGRFVILWSLAMTMNTLEDLAASNFRRGEYDWMRDKLSELRICHELRLQQVKAPPRQRRARL